MEDKEILGIISDLEEVGINETNEEKLMRFLKANRGINSKSFAVDCLRKFNCQFVKVKYKSAYDTLCAVSFYYLKWGDIIFAHNGIKSQETMVSIEIITMDKWMKGLFLA